MVLACPSTGAREWTELRVLGIGSRSQQPQSSVGHQRLDQPATSCGPASSRPGGGAIPADRLLGKLAQRRRADRDQRFGGGSALHDRHHALEHDSRVLPTAAAAVQLSADRLGLAELEPTAAPLAAPAVAQPRPGGEPHGALAGLLGRGTSPAASLDAMARTIRRDLPINARIVVSPAPTRSCSTWPTSGLVDLQQATPPERIQRPAPEPAIWPAASSGTRPTGRCRSSGKRSCGRWWLQAPCLGGPAQPDLSDSDR